MKKTVVLFTVIAFSFLFVLAGCENEEGSYPKLTVTNGSSTTAVDTIMSKSGINGIYDASAVTAKVVVGAVEFDISSLSNGPTEAECIEEMDLFNGSLQIIYTSGTTETVLYEVPMLSTRIESNISTEADNEYTFTFNLEEDSFAISKN